ncbi:hypothetical protein HC028_24885 [Planosporangium flavigriseum]|uniref:hypothetical protein n=1 Tax=Planosporangium flavigriseum TaxID=373681 RepID=UPI001439121C|nr:hypothetical protein [Planosporangium flavigriseum]NJC67716.1 hypothetical protein [Planosporangium flavigriseum]
MAFRSGIDLSQQVLPGGDDYVYVPDAANAIERARSAVDCWTDPIERDNAQNMLASLSRDVDGGQRQLLLRVSLYQRSRPVVGTAVLDLLRAAV